jgi:hypothetical protein
MVGQPDLNGQILYDITCFYYGPRVSKLSSEKLAFSQMWMANKERIVST